MASNRDDRALDSGLDGDWPGREDWEVFDLDGAGIEALLPVPFLEGEVALFGVRGNEA